jgi:predicted site-specific integrase-resolvase
VESPSSDADEVAVSARAAAADQRSDLDRQVVRLADDATAAGWRGEWRRTCAVVVGQLQTAVG